MLIAQMSNTLVQLWLRYSLIDSLIIIIVVVVTVDVEEVPY